MLFKNKSIASFMMMFVFLFCVSMSNVIGGQVDDELNNSSDNTEINTTSEDNTTQNAIMITSGVFGGAVMAVGTEKLFFERNASVETVKIRDEKNNTLETKIMILNNGGSKTVTKKIADLVNALNNNKLEESLDKIKAAIPTITDVASGTAPTAVVAFGGDDVKTKNLETLLTTYTTLTEKEIGEMVVNLADPAKKEAALITLKDKLKEPFKDIKPQSGVASELDKFLNQAGLKVLKDGLTKDMNTSKTTIADCAETKKVMIQAFALKESTETEAQLQTRLTTEEGKVATFKADLEKAEKGVKALLILAGGDKPRYEKTITKTDQAAILTELGLEVKGQGGGNWNVDPKILAAIKKAGGTNNGVANIADDATATGKLKAYLDKQHASDVDVLKEAATLFGLELTTSDVKRGDTTLSADGLSITNANFFGGVQVKIEDLTAGIEKTEAVNTTNAKDKKVYIYSKINGADNLFNLEVREIKDDKLDKQYNCIVKDFKVGKLGTYGELFKSGAGQDDNGQIIEQKTFVLDSSKKVTGIAQYDVVNGKIVNGEVSSSVDGDTFKVSAGKKAVGVVASTVTIAGNGSTTSALKNRTVTTTDAGLVVKDMIAGKEQFKVEFDNKLSSVKVWKLDDVGTTLIPFIDFNGYVAVDGTAASDIFSTTQKNIGVQLYDRKGAKLAIGSSDKETAISVFGADDVKFATGTTTPANEYGASGVMK